MTVNRIYITELFKNVPVGTAFVKDDAVYIRINEIESTQRKHYNAVNLRSGKPVDFLASDSVMTCQDATIVI